MFLFYLVIILWVWSLCKGCGYFYHLRGPISHYRGPTGTGWSLSLLLIYHPVGKYKSIPLYSTMTCIGMEANRSSEKCDIQVWDKTGDNVICILSRYFQYFQIDEQIQGDEQNTENPHDLWHKEESCEIVAAKLRKGCSRNISMSPRPPPPPPTPRQPFWPTYNFFLYPHTIYFISSYILIHRSILYPNSLSCYKRTMYYHHLYHKMLGIGTDRSVSK